MNEQEKLDYFLEKLKALALEKLEQSDKTALDVLKEAINYIEGEFQGY